MKKNIVFVGLDVHAETIAVAVTGASGEVRSLGKIPNRPEAIKRLMQKLGPAASLRVCYEAGPTGYVLPLTTAETALADGQRVVASRHAHLHDPDPSRLLLENGNATIYAYGYLNEADSLCYWERERAQVRQLVLGSGDTIPGCALGF